MNAPERPEIQVIDLGYADYEASWKLQEWLLRRFMEIKLYNREAPAEARKPMPHYLLLCEHNPVYTLGKSGNAENILADENKQKMLGVEVFRINRGGDVTYHGPGQITGYPILDLEFFFTDLHKYMRSLEEVVVRLLGYYGIRAGRIKGLTGVWVDADHPYQARKICALGVHMSRWITMHGFGLNVNPRLDMFSYIVPCGIRDKGVTSMALELGFAPPLDEVKARIINCFGEVFKASMKMTAQEEAAQMLKLFLQEAHSPPSSFPDVFPA